MKPSKAKPRKAKPILSICCACDGLLFLCFRFWGRSQHMLCENDNDDKFQNQ